MVLNSQVNLYGKEVPTQVAYTSKSKGLKLLGLKFPFGEISDGNFLNKSSELEVIKSNLRQLLMTTRGQRVMLPKFGTNIRNYLMEPLDQALLSQIRRELLESMSLYAPSVVLNKLVVYPLESGNLSGGNAIKIELFCTLREDANLSFEVKVDL
jgi:phage baseplate assembly protein W